MHERYINYQYPLKEYQCSTDFYVDRNNDNIIGFSLRFSNISPNGDGFGIPSYYSTTGDHMIFSMFYY